jgi:hypothetical protein
LFLVNAVVFVEVDAVVAFARGGQEYCAKVKGFLRSVGARTTQTVMGALGTALEKITSSDIGAWFTDPCAHAMH